MADTRENDNEMSFHEKKTGFFFSQAELLSASQ
jgi:hypothetical protein